MIKDKEAIIEKICYTELVYGRINKKLDMNLTNHEIEMFIMKAILDTQQEGFEIIGKNYYLNNYKENIRLTINRNTYRIITADKLKF